MNILFPSRALTHLALGLLTAALAQPPAVAQAPATPIPHIDRTGVHPALIVDGKPFLMLGAQINNSSSWAATLPAVWPVMDELHANTVEAPIYWETLEPEPNRFDYAQVDLLLTEARAHNKRLVLLWFGTWKNGSPGYTPEWIKRDGKRFPLAVKANGVPNFSLSPFGEQTLAADKHAFVALMQHLRDADPQHTVLMVQVENETGMWGAPRDFSPAANRVFAQPVPAEVLHAMGKATQGSWSEVFGPDADEVFYAWAIARYVNQVAEAGKQVNPLPLYVNAALRDPIHPGTTGSFESGGPTFDVLALWHSTAPALDAIGPDIYLPEYDKYTAVLKQYALLWNPFFVPETGNRTSYARFFFAALGAGGFGWSPFGMDRTAYTNFPLGAERIDSESLAPFALNYRIAGPIAPELARWNQQGRVYGVAEPSDVHTQQVAFAPLEGKPARWSATVSYGLPAFYTNQAAPGNKEPSGEALIVQLGPDEFLVSAAHARVDFAPVAAVLGPSAQRMWLTVEEGTYQNGAWQRDRLWNGDQTDYGLNFSSVPQLLRVRLLAY